jgi:hypothetical protein
MQSQQTKVLKLGRSYDAGVLYGDSRLLGFEFAAMETTMHGGRLNLVASPPWVERLQSDSGHPSTEECPGT